MRCLDIGCCAGEVSLTAAEVVGPSGRVLGIDRGPDAIATARAKTTVGAGVSFELSELDAFERSGHFDAIVGRFILMHQPDPVAVLRSLLASLRPGGVVVIVESWMELIRTGGHSEPLSPLYDEIVQWKSAVGRGATCRRPFQKGSSISR